MVDVFLAVFVTFIMIVVIATTWRNFTETVSRFVKWATATTMAALAVGGIVAVASEGNASPGLAFAVWGTAAMVLGWYLLMYVRTVLLPRQFARVAPLRAVSLAGRHPWVSLDILVVLGVVGLVAAAVLYFEPQPPLGIAAGGLAASAAMFAVRFWRHRQNVRR